MPRSRRSAARRRSAGRFVVLLLGAGAVLALIVIGACGSGGKKNSSNRTSTQGAVQIRPLTTVPGTRAAGQTPGPTGTFAPAPPTPASTCAPAELLRLVNKEAALPAEYTPDDLTPLQRIDSSPQIVIALSLRREAEAALHRMLEQARTANVFILVQSAYRSYDDQSRVYQAEVTNYGQAQADRESARQGHSEHQLGLAVDFTAKSLAYDLNDSFAVTTEGKWLRQNAVQFGFVLSYPQGKEAETGYMYEPWHYRYLGPAAAQAFAASGQTLNRWLAARQLGCGA